MPLKGCIVTLYGLCQLDMAGSAGGLRRGPGAGQPGRGGGRRGDRARLEPVGDEAPWSAFGGLTRPAGRPRNGSGPGRPIGPFVARQPVARPAEGTMIPARTQGVPGLGSPQPFPDPCRNPRNPATRTFLLPVSIPGIVTSTREVRRCTRRPHWERRTVLFEHRVASPGPSRCSKSTLRAAVRASRTPSEKSKETSPDAQRCCVQSSIFRGRAPNNWRRCNVY